MPSHAPGGQALVQAVRSSNVLACRALLSAHVVQDISSVGPTGVSALHLAVWRNHLELVELLLQAGADPNVPDAESGWTALHRAFHFGHLRIAAALLAANASLSNCLDWQQRTPLDLVSAELKGLLPCDGPGEVWCWGNGTNFTLGTGKTDLQLTPARLDSLHGTGVVAVAAAKFHSAAVAADGSLRTWGWGHGGRLGHPEAHIHSGESAVISPRLVAGLGRRNVVALAAAKNHTLLCTSAGEAFTMGCNRHGQLGYAVDTQPTPRRVTSLRGVMAVAVAAANKHSVVISASGDAFTFGSNALGQLGYGTFDSASSAAPRLVEAMKGRKVVAAAAAKRHTMVLTSSGEVFVWGHRAVSPRRVVLAGARDACTSAGVVVRFHRGHSDVARPVAAAICAGAAHSCALTTTGAVLAWRSADPALLVQEITGGGLGGQRVVALSAGKYRTAAVTDAGDVYAWEGRADYFPAEGRPSGSGSAKEGSRARGRPIPAAPLPAGTLGRLADVGGSGASSEHRFSGASPGSYGSAGRQQAGSFFERAYSQRAKERDAPPLRQAEDAFAPIVPQRVHGVKRVGAVAVGEKHSLALQLWSAVQLEGLEPIPWLGGEEKAAGAGQEEAEEVPGTPHAESEAESSADSPFSSPSRLACTTGVHASGCGPSAATGPPSLQHICEEAVAVGLVDPRTALQVLEYADAAGAGVLRSYCLAVACCNLDAVLLEAGGAFEALPPHLMAELERVYKQRLQRGAWPASPASLPAASDASAARAGPSSSTTAQGLQHGGSGSRLQPGRRPTAAPAYLGDAGTGRGQVPLEEAWCGVGASLQALPGESSFQNPTSQAAAEAAHRLRRNLTKKLQQIARLEERLAGGDLLDVQQAAKVGQRSLVVAALAALDSGVPAEDVGAMLQAAAAAEGALLGSSPSSTPTPAGKEGPVGARGAGGGGGKAKLRRRTTSERSVVSPSQNPTAAVCKGDAPVASVPPATLSLPGPVPVSYSPSGVAPSFGGPAATHVVGFTTSGSTASAGAGGSGGPAPANRAKGKKAAVKKGGLSMFLRGELEAGFSAELHGHAQPASAAASSGSAAAPWGCKPPTPAAATPLKDILTQQKASAAAEGPSDVRKRTPGLASPAPSSGGKPSRAAPLDAAPSPAGPTHLSLASFMQPTHPVAIGGSGEGPAWVTAGASPPGPSRPLPFREIQQEQERRRQEATPIRGSSPPVTARPPLPGAARAVPAASGKGASSAALLGTSPLGGSAASCMLLGTSPSGRVTFQAAPVPQQSKWYVAEEDEQHLRRMKSLKAIQTEESAMKQLESRYGAGNVRIGRAGGGAPPVPKPR